MNSGSRFGDMLQPIQRSSAQRITCDSAGRYGASPRHRQIFGFEVCTTWNEVASCIEMSIWQPGWPGVRSRPCSAVIADEATVSPVIVCAGNAAP